MTTQRLRFRTLLAKSCQIGLALVSLGAQAADKPLGDTSFNPTNRLAVTNLVASYGPLYDQFKLTEWRALGRWPKHPVGINLGKSKITPLEKAAEDYANSFRVLRDFAP